MAGQGALAEWLGSGLQSRLQQFESARRLYLPARRQHQGRRMSLLSSAVCFCSSVSSERLTGVTIDQCLPTGQR
jgi:hypothetical protein